MVYNELIFRLELNYVPSSSMKEIMSPFERFGQSPLVASIINTWIERGLLSLTTLYAALAVWLVYTFLLITYRRKNETAPGAIFVEGQDLTKNYRCFLRSRVFQDQDLLVRLSICIFS